MSVIFWTVEELATVSVYLAPQGLNYGGQQVAEELAAVSVANVAEFVETYGDRQGSPVPHTAQEIRLAAALQSGNPKEALQTLTLLGSNVLTVDPVVRLRAFEALGFLLTQALRRAA